MVPPCSDRISRVPPYSRTCAPLRIRGYHPLRPAFPDPSASCTQATGLLRVRSPLLAESLLMSFPPGTEMFQFPGFASPAYVFSGRYPSLGGFPHSDIHGSTPARGSPWLFAACHVLHRLLVPRHPPNALIALKTTPYTHRNHPHPRNCPILLLCRSFNAIFCASGAHGLTSTALRFSKITPTELDTAKSRPIPAQDMAGDPVA